MPGKVLALLACAAIAGCSGGGSSGTPAPAAAPAAVFLTEAEVQRILEQAVGEAQARGVHAHVAVVDRLGNVLAVFGMNGAPASVRITSGRDDSTSVAGLDGVQGIPAAFSAITKAITGAYLSSGGNAFTTRTAGQIIQEHFNPNESQQPSGPLYGVQFSQLSCSDVNRNLGHGGVGPKRSPLGLSADPGGLPLYKNGVLVGGIGIEADGVYTFDRDLRDLDDDAEERIAVAGATGFAAPDDIRADRITADGRTLRFIDGDGLASNPLAAAPLASLPGSLKAVDGFLGGVIRSGRALGAAGSGVRADDGAFAAQGGWILVDAANLNRFPPRDAAAGSLRATEVRRILADALAVAMRTRAQIRRPLGSAAQVAISVVDTDGNILGLVRTADAPVFGIDVAVQKARTAMFFSHPGAAADFGRASAFHQVPFGAVTTFALYPGDLAAFAGEQANLTGQVAFTSRTIGNLHRPFFPDGIEGTPPGPFSHRIAGLFASWSPFNVGLQLDLSFNQVIAAVTRGDTQEGCAGRQFSGGGTSLERVRNGLQIFPGGVPIYRGEQLVGGVGVSGDGVDQDDMIAFLGLANAGRALGGMLGNAPASMRADQLAPQGVRLRFVQCPQAPFIDSNEQNVCAGL